MSCLMRPWGHMHYHDHGPAGAPAVMFANSLGTDARIWAGVIDRMPGVRCITHDKRGHGLSATPPDGWTVQDLAADSAALIRHLGLGPVVVVGCSVGGMIAQALALGEPGLTRGLVLCNTAAKLGTAESWQQRIDAVRDGGLSSIADAVLDRWFAPAFVASDEVRPWRGLLTGCDADGYIGMCRALAAADLRTDVGRIACPVLMVAGAEDRAAPPDVVRDTAALIAGARVAVLERSGHIPAIDAPDRLAGLITAFIGGLA